MRLGNTLRAAAVAVALLSLLSAPLLADGARSILVRDGAVLGGTSIPEGQYKLRWESTGGDAVKIKILRGSTVVATADGTMEQRGSESASDSLVYKPNGNGTRELSEIRFANKKQVITIKG